METHAIETRFGPVRVRVYRLEEGWWPVVLEGRRSLPEAPLLDGPLPQSVREAVAQMALAIDRLDVPDGRLGYGCHGCGWRSWAWEPRQAALELEAHDCVRVEPWIGLTATWRAALFDGAGAEEQSGASLSRRSP